MGVEKKRCKKTREPQKAVIPQLHGRQLNASRRGIEFGHPPPG